MVKKVKEVELRRFSVDDYMCDLWIGDICTLNFCWKEFKRINPTICKGLRPGETRKLKRTQLKNGFKLEIAKPKT